MKLIARVVPSLCFLLFFSSCFDIIEVVTLNKKGGGTFLFEIDLAKSQDFINDPNNHHEYTDGEPITHKLQRLFKADENELEHINGISEVRSIKDNNRFLYGIEFEFENVWALNKALNRLEKSLDSEKDMSRQKVYFNYEKNMLTRVGAMDFEQDIRDHMHGYETDLRPFNKVIFTTEYILPKKVKKLSHPKGKISSDGTKVTAIYHPFGPKADHVFDNQIHF